MSQLKDYIYGKDDFGIICHKSPDGDTLGSGLAVYHGLKQLGKSCSIYCSDVPERLYAVLTGIEKIKPLSELKESNLIFCDCSDEERAAFDLDLKRFDVLNIDHHISNTNFGNVNVIDSNACATCELMCSVFEEIGVALDVDIAKCLYVGICTDTNNFTNSNVTENTFMVMSKISKFNFGMTDIVRSLFRTKSLAKTKAIAMVINNMRMFSNGKVCVTYLNYEDLLRLELDNTEGLVDMCVDIEGVSVCAFLKGNGEGSYKISLRSNYDVDVRKICETYGGGGHVKAAGCMIKGKLEDVISKISLEVAKWME